MESRPSWDEYFIDLCNTIAKRSTCDRKHVGCVIVDQQNHILSTGYNGALSGLPDCDTLGHLMIEGHCQRIVHAEQNAICHAARKGVLLEGSKIYCNTFPCWDCFKLAVAAGIKEILFTGDYPSKNKDTVLAIAKELEAISSLNFKGIRMLKMDYE